MLWEVAISKGLRMVINTNVSSLRVANMMRASVRNMNDSIGRLSSGSRMLNPADDAAGLAVATKFTSQIHRLDAARNSVANTLSFVQTADGYMQKIEKAINRMGELAALANDRTKSASDLENYNFEFLKDNAVMQVTYKSDLEKNLKTILYDNDFRKELIQNGQKHLHRYLLNHGNASEYFAKILSSL